MRHFRSLFPCLPHCGFCRSRAGTAPTSRPRPSTPSSWTAKRDRSCGRRTPITATPPASMSKLMTLELLFQHLKDGTRQTDGHVSRVAARLEHAGLEDVREPRLPQVPVEDLIRGIIITSGNDACVVVAEALGGTVEGFVDMMNKRAKQLGLTQSHFVNPNGLPDPPGQLMSVHDLAKLARHLIYDLSAILSLLLGAAASVWNNITQQNRDAVLGQIPRHGRTEDRPHRRGGLRHRHLRGQQRPAADPGAERSALSAARQDRCPRPRTGTACSCAATRPRA